MADIQLIQCKNQHYIKTVSGKVVAQSIVFRVVSIYFMWMCKIFRGCQRMAKVPNGVETLPAE